MAPTPQLHLAGFKTDPRKGPHLERCQLGPTQHHPSGLRLGIAMCAWGMQRVETIGEGGVCVRKRVWVGGQTRTRKETHICTCEKESGAPGRAGGGVDGVNSGRYRQFSLCWSPLSLLFPKAEVDGRSPSTPLQGQPSTPEPGPLGFHPHPESLLLYGALLPQGGRRLTAFLTLLLWGFHLNLLQ